jgi:hypothetical protein
VLEGSLGPVPYKATGCLVYIYQGYFIGSRSLLTNQLVVFDYYGDSVMILGKFGSDSLLFQPSSLLVLFSNPEMQLATWGGDAQSHAVVDSSPLLLI